MSKPKIEPVIMRIPEGRISFYNATEAKYRTDKFGKPVKTRPDGTAVKPQFRMTWLLDPSKAEIQAFISKLKQEAARQLDIFFDGRANWPKDNATTGTKGVLLCFGNGNDLPKVYEGYKDMFYIKVADAVAPIIGDYRGRHIQLGTDNAWHVLANGRPTEEIVDPDKVPYAGAYGTGTISLYVYNNTQAGVNANFRSVQFLRSGAAFGGGKPRTAAEELQQMAGDAEGTGQSWGDDDSIPF